MVLRKKSSLPPGQALEYAGQILEALDAAHRKVITRRDLPSEADRSANRFPLSEHPGTGDFTLTQVLTAQRQIVETLGA